MIKGLVSTVNCMYNIGSIEKTDKRRYPDIWDNDKLESWWEDHKDTEHWPCRVYKVIVEENQPGYAFHGREAMWSNPKSEPPKIGDIVKINFNGLGSGKVDSYFIEHGFLGVTVVLDNEPDWHKKQCKGTPHAGIAMAFGRELI